MRSLTTDKLLLLLLLAICQPLRPTSAISSGPGPQRPIDGAVLARLTPEQRALVEWSTRGPEAAIKEQLQQVEKELKAQASRQFNEKHRKRAAEGVVTSAAAAVTAAQTEGFDQAAYDAEHAALLAIKDGASGSVFSSWADNTSHCTEWGDSVACNEAGRVTKLSLTLCDFDGSLPNKQLEVLSKLQFLELANVDFTEDTQLPATWPAAFPEMSFLTVRLTGKGGSDSVTGEALSGSIPSTWGDWKALEHLILESNRIAGTIPSSLAKLSSLQTLSLSSNELTGAVPDLSGMTSLVTLSLAFNQLTGTVTGLDRLVNLTNLYLSSNNFSGDLPALPSSIVEAILSLCDFTGGLPSSYASLVNLRWLNLESNPRLGGVVPAAYSSLTSLEAFVAKSCGLTGIEPGLVLPNAALVWLSSNSIETLPTDFEGWSQLTVLDLSRNKIGGRLPATLSNLPSVFWMDLSFNRLTGPLPDWKAWKLGEYTGFDLSRNCLSSDKAIPCLEPSRLPTRLSICFNPVSPEVCGANAGTLSGCVPPQVGGNNPEFGDYAMLFCADFNSWREGTGLAYCGIESYSRAEINSTCVQQLNSPLDPACSSDRNATAAQPWGFVNQGPSSGVMRMPVAEKIWWEVEQKTSWCSISRGVGYASASCSVNSRGQERITFNLTTANADNITKRMYWTGCQPLKAPADAAGPAQTTTRPCNKWAAVPINAKKVRSPAYTSTTWTVNLPKRSCSCEQVYWSLFAKSDTVCGADGP